MTKPGFSPGLQFGVSLALYSFISHQRSASQLLYRFTSGRATQRSQTVNFSSRSACVAIMTRLFLSLSSTTFPVDSPVFSSFCQALHHPAKGLFIQLARINEMVGMTCLAVFDLRECCDALTLNLPVNVGSEHSRTAFHVGSGNGLAGAQ